MSYNQKPMHSDIAISVRDVSKKFKLFSSLKERLTEALHPFRKQCHHEFWALNGVSFDIRRGEIIGILGRNGSGKSTLLQIICSVMQATKGKVQVNGRISALLELGAGFNPEFSGRDNVLLNGIIMGISRKEMLRMLPEIEAFADVGDFFDQPVKTYSSGMFVRVAFAAAIHVDPDIMVIDEALAVGDARFQHKCFEKLDNFRSANKTIILVTHSISQVTAHCDRAILLDRGHILMDGAPREVSDRYIELLFSDLAPDSDTGSKMVERRAELGIKGNLVDVDHELVLDGIKRMTMRRSYCKDEIRYGDKTAEIFDCVLESEGVFDPPQYTSGKPISIYLKVVFHRSFEPSIGFALKTGEGVEIYATNTHLLRMRVLNSRLGDMKLFKFTFSPILSPGEYFLDVGVGERDGSPSGVPSDVRRSAALIMLASDDYPLRFNGLLDLSPGFKEINSVKSMEVLEG